MEDDSIAELDLFRAVASSGARALLIGRRAMVVYGLPVLTADYDYWIAGDDIVTFNSALAKLGLEPNRSLDEARGRGRYVLEGGEHLDVIVARSMSTLEGEPVVFDDLWGRRVSVPYEGDTSVQVPSLPDLIRTKRVSARAKDATDITLLERLLKDRPDG